MKNDADRLLGGDGNDRIAGRRGDDLLRGGPGHDTLLGGQGNDTLQGGRDDDTLRGGTGNDLLRGSAGQDRIWGGDGNDRLIGGTGADTMHGGAGRDRFVFQSIDGQVDRIVDFNVEEDEILLRQPNFGDLAQGPLAEDSFGIGEVAVGASDRIIYDDQTGYLFFDTDGSGETDAIAIARLSRGLDLQASNIRVI